MSGVSSVVVYSAGGDEYLSFGETGPNGEFEMSKCEIDPIDGTIFEHARANIGPAGVAALQAFFAQYVPAQYDPIHLGA